MTQESPFADVPAGLGRALEGKGFTELTPVQRAVLEPKLASRDLRLSSQTGSGKTVAIGFVLASALDGIEAQPPRARVAKPRVLLIAPTRELAQQIARELSWLFRPLNARVAVVTGGVSIAGDFKFFSDQPHVLVGTPGRLVDHIKRKSLDLAGVRSVVLDEADEMLDMGFREDLTVILDGTPEDRQTHLVSATLPPEVLRLANHYQRDAARVQGTRAGAGHADIAHIGHVVRPRDRQAALINLLLAEPERRTLVFVRTRVATCEVANALIGNGFSAGALNGEMGQRERNAMLDAFRRNDVRIVVATDVAARGLDVEDVGQVIHLDLPENPDVLTHRSGRTGRAGHKGTSIALVPSGARGRFGQFLHRAGINMTWQPVPSAKSIRAAADARLIREIRETRVDDARMSAVAETLLDGAEATDVVAALLSRLDHAGPCSPLAVAELAAEPSRKDKAARPDRTHPERKGKAARQDRGNAERNGAHSDRGHKSSFTPFHVGWGANAGANVSRLLAMVCRRGDVRSQHIGAIRIGPNRSVVEVASHLAEDFARAALKPDERNPKIKVIPWNPTATRQGSAPHHRSN